MATDIRDEVSVGGYPGDGKGDNAVAPKTFEAVAKPEKEYAAGGNWYSLVDLPRALPWSIDDLTGELGTDLYEKMMKDAQVESAVDVLKVSILEDGIRITPAVDKKGQDGYDQAKQFADDATIMLSDMTESFDDVLRNMLDAIAVGHKMAELVYDMESTPSGLMQYRLSSLAVKPMHSTAFVVDAYLNVLGIVAKIPGQAWNVQQGSLLSDLQSLPNFLPRSKFAIFSFRPRDKDPRGVSLLRAAFSPWNMKQQLVREYLKYLTQFASPSLAGFTATDADPVTVMNPDGTPQTDAFGNPVVNYPVQDMLNSLLAFQNGTAMAFVGDARLQPIEMTGDGAPFLNAFAYLDVQITKAVLHQTLATEEGQHQTRASSGTHKDMLDTIVRQSKRPLQQMIERDILRNWVILNNGAKMAPLTPKVSLGDAEQEDRARLWAGIASLYQSGYLTPSQLPQTDVIASLPVRLQGEESAIPTRELIADKEEGLVAGRSGAGAAGTAGKVPDGNPALGKGTVPSPDTTNTGSER